jgi:hypothetical protein
METFSLAALNGDPNAFRDFACTLGTLPTVNMWGGLNSFLSSGDPLLQDIRNSKDLKFKCPEVQSEWDLSLRLLIPDYGPKSYVATGRNSRVTMYWPAEDPEDMVGTDGLLQTENALYFFRYLQGFLSDPNNRDEKLKEKITEVRDAVSHPMFMDYVHWYSCFRLISEAILELFANSLVYLSVNISSWFNFHGRSVVATPFE